MSNILKTSVMKAKEKLYGRTMLKAAVEEKLLKMKPAAKKDGRGRELVVSVKRLEEEVDKCDKALQAEASSKCSSFRVFLPLCSFVKAWEKGEGRGDNVEFRLLFSGTGLLFSRERECILGYNVVFFPLQRPNRLQGGLSVLHRQGNRRQQLW